MPEYALTTAQNLYFKGLNIIQWGLYLKGNKTCENCLKCV